MIKINKNEQGFSAVEFIMIIIIIGLIGAVAYLVYKNHHQPVKVVTLTKTVSTTNNSSASTSSTKYLKITQLGIEIPLNSSISDLSYSWDGQQAILVSPTLEKYASEQDSSCSATLPADLSTSSNYQQIGSIDGSTTADNDSTSNVTLGGKVYSYHETSSGCSSNQNVINEVSTYSSNFATAFEKAQTIN